MFRKLSSLTLVLFMTFLVGAKDLALGFCLCHESLFLGKNPCSQSSPSDCCEHDEDAGEQKPCDDCIVPLQLEIDDYVWSSDSFDFQIPAPIAGKELAPLVLPAGSSRLAFRLSFPLEPPPPQGKDILIRHSRLLI
ncbi:hypothetical protein AAFN60_11740 [Roseibacillus persicicus]|uniref:hypothetical protein n=1 Tax=Roseibacillus persicicus TaxID=454148 RepID=UPI00398A5977